MPGPIIEESLMALDGDTGLIQQENEDFIIVDETIIVEECNPIFDKFATAQEDGCTRFRRLRLLGYV